MKNWLVALIGIILTTMHISTALAAGNAVMGKDKSLMCASCHGADGNSLAPTFPKLAGQGEAYLLKQLRDIKSGARPSPMMAPFVAVLTEQDMADISAYYAANSLTLTPNTASESILAMGKTIYKAGNKETGVPACMACHGPNGLGYPAAKWPALSSQHAFYIESQLTAYAEGTRHNDPNSMMQDIAGRLSKDELKAVSAYVSGLH